MMLASLPEDTADDARIKTLVRNNCTGCHTPSYTLQHKFDEDGWSRIIELMKNVNVSGVYIGHERKPNGVLDHNQKELAAYLARARGPGETSMKMKLRPRPSGETARVVVKEYDVPMQEDAGLPSQVRAHGRQRLVARHALAHRLARARRLGRSRRQSLVHLQRAQHKTTIGRVDAKTGETKMYRVPKSDGLAANTHGMVRDPQGIIWFNVNTGRGSLGELDPKTQQDRRLHAADGHAADRRRHHGRLSTARA